ncbi:MAG: DNA repair protein RecO [Candidatus Yanofskybacteria bacterium]|nr:DNA repair protein RecO [Candidatus Yanofskybacteria bacterium]
MQTEAFILKKQPHGEYDQLLTCYTQELGKITAVAKSSLKQNSIQGMHLDLFNHVEFDLVSGRGVPIITGAQVISGYSKLKDSLPSLSAGYFFLEVFDRIIFDYERDDQLWEFLGKLFGNLNGQEIKLADFRQYQKALLQILGYAPAVLTSQEQNTRTHSVLDTAFEETAQARFSSLRLIYNVLN